MPCSRMVNVDSHVIKEISLKLSRKLFILIKKVSNERVFRSNETAVVSQQESNLFLKGYLLKNDDFSKRVI